MYKKIRYSLVKYIKVKLFSLCQKVNLTFNPKRESVIIITEKTLTIKNKILTSKVFSV